MSNVSERKSEVGRLSDVSDVSMMCRVCGNCEISEMRKVMKEWRSEVSRLEEERVVGLLSEWSGKDVSEVLRDLEVIENKVMRRRGWK